MEKVPTLNQEPIKSMVEVEWNDRKGERLFGEEHRKICQRGLARIYEIEDKDKGTLSSLATRYGAERDGEANRRVPPHGSQYRFSPANYTNMTELLSMFTAWVGKSRWEARDNRDRVQALQDELVAGLLTPNNCFVEINLGVTEDPTVLPFSCQQLGSLWADTFDQFGDGLFRT